jgi:hypothetical protein
MRPCRNLRLSRLALSWLLPVSVAAAMAIPTSSALAQCATTGVAPATVTVTCATNTVTTATVNSTSPNLSTSDRIQAFNANLIGQVNSGVTVSGQGLELDSSKANGSVSLANNGTITLASGNAVVFLGGNGGGASYSGNGAVTGTGANTFGLLMVDNSAGAGAMTVNATGGSITAVGNSVFGLGV